MSKPPKYVTSVEDSSATPYGCTVHINGIAYGKGIGSSKKLAKNSAAKSTLHLLIPELKEKLQFGEGDDRDASEEAARAAEERERVSSSNGLRFFDDIRVDDPRVADLCNKVSEPSPYAVLVTCLQK